MSGTISNSELSLLFTDLGYTITAEVLAELLIDTKVMKKEVLCLARFIAAYEADEGQRRDKGTEVVEEEEEEEEKGGVAGSKTGAGGSMGSGLPGNGIVFEDFWKVLKLFRSREGFLFREVAEFHAAFDKFDADKSGELSVAELGGVLRSLGYCPSVQRLQELTAVVDADNSGYVDQTEYLRLMRNMREQEVKRLAQALALFRQERQLEPEDPAPVLEEPMLFWKSRAGKDLCRFLYHTFGHEPTPALLREAVNGGIVESTDSGASLLSGSAHDAQSGEEEKIERVRPLRLTPSALIRIYQTYRHAHVRDVCATSGGFSEQELIGLKMKFRRTDKDHSGYIEGFELEAFLQSVLPQRLKGTEAGREKVDKVIRHADAEGDGKLSLQDFLLFMRDWENEVEERELVRELAARRETKFTRREVVGFREVFVSFDRDRSGNLQERELREMLQKVLGVAIGMDPASKPLEAQLIEEIDNDGDSALDFSEFLRLIRKLLDSNYCGINDKAAKIVEDEVLS